jgi:tetratricopeptide (TPR) repeat protein
MSFSSTSNGISNTAPAPIPQRQVSTVKAVAFVVGISIMGVLRLPVDPHRKIVLLFALVVLLIAPIILLMALSQAKRRVLQLAKQGDYDQALRLDKQYSRIPGYGTPLDGVILFQAGRYSEAQLLVKPLAFDSNGQPRLTSQALYIYCLALVNGDRPAEAQTLLEAAVQAPQQNGGFHVALSTCLLTQNKDPEHALALIEQAMANWPATLNDYEGRADQMRRLGRYAWALAACGRAGDAQAKLQEAFAGAADFRPDDMAGLQYFAGETWRVIGDSTKARAAFKEALRLAVAGSAAATSAQKGLAKLANQ